MLESSHAEQNGPTTRRDPVLGCYISTTNLTDDGYSRRSPKLLAAFQAEINGQPFPGRAHITLYLHRIAYIAQHGHNPPANEHVHIYATTQPASACLASFQSPARQTKTDASVGAN
jgi:hypothetical protein